MSFSFVNNGKEYRVFSMNSGRAMHINFPYFNLEYTVISEDSREESVTDGVVTLQFKVPRIAKLLWVKKI